MTLVVTWALTLVVYSGDKVEKVLSGTDEVLGIAGALQLVAIA